MFDLRYHVVSIAAVFLALCLGIILGVAISDPEPLADRAENLRLRNDVAELNRLLESAENRLQQQRAADVFVDKAYGAVMTGRLANRRIVVVSVGRVEDRVAEVTAAVGDAGGTIVRMRALTLPEEAEPIETALGQRPALAGYVGDEHLDDLGRDLGREIVDGGRTPLLDTLDDVLVRQQDGASDAPADAVVVVRSARPQAGELGRFLQGLYAGLSAGVAAAVGAEVSAARPSAVRAFRRADFSTVDNVDTKPGKVALAVLLAGEARGQYGTDAETATDGPLPTIEAVSPGPVAG